MMIRIVPVNSVIEASHACKGLRNGNNQVSHPSLEVSARHTHAMSSVTRSHAEENLYSSQLPKHIVRFFLKCAINGTYQTNPSQFEHFDMDHIGLNVGGTSIQFKAL